MRASSPGGPRKGPKKFLNDLFFEEGMREYTYVGAAVKIGVVDRTARHLEGRVSVGVTL